MFPLNGGNLTMASSCVRSIVVIPCTLGSKLSMRAGSEHTSVSHVLRVIAVLSTSISRQDKAVECQSDGWVRNQRSLGVAGKGGPAERTQVELKSCLS